VDTSAFQAANTDIVSGQVHGHDVVVASEVMRKLMQMLERVARSNGAVLISGETGCGKEFIARAIHQRSLRCNRPWVDLNCAALPENLVESELFGYERGAFSGAESAKPGLFELADKGTLFLDEIGELEPKVQVKLLRVLDGVAYYRLGGHRKVDVDVRIVAATNQDLDEGVRCGRFRSDLYHRLCQFQLKVPPLRERPDDIRALAEFFLHQQKPDADFSADALDALSAYSWPGNVRELRNTVLQAATLAETSIIGIADLPGEITVPERASEEQMTTDLSDMERKTIIRVLDSTGGHQGHAADQLGISRRTLSRKLKSYKIDVTRNAKRSLGEMDRERQRYFRATLDVPIHLKFVAGKTFEGRTTNVSLGGVGLTGLDNPQEYGNLLELSFTLPNTDVRVHCNGAIAWVEASGRAGIRFDSINPLQLDRLKDWLATRQREEGWMVEV
jgi:transcriptional regulator with GAF, ATPase, and Fis domain